MRPKFGDRAADYLSSNMGRWLFIFMQTVVYVGWIGWNRCTPASYHFDSQDLLILNLAIGIFGNYAFSILLMSQNRQTAKDHALLMDTHNKVVAELQLLKHQKG